MTIAQFFPVIIAALVFGIFPALVMAFFSWHDALSEPKLKGVPLPDVDDKRWEYRHGDYELGSFCVSERGYVYFRMRHLGVWKRYLRAVQRNYGKVNYKDMAKQAQEELSR